VLSFTDTRAHPEPQTRIGSAEQIDLIRAQFKASHAEFCHRLHPIDKESDPQVFVGEQSLDYVSNRLL
jgi:hypothetical protein